MSDDKDNILRSPDGRDTYFSYEGKVSLWTHPMPDEPFVIDVAGALYARNRQEAAFMVAKKLEDRIANDPFMNDED